MPAEIASQVGPYIIQRELGRGGMGIVYLAVDSRLGREVAVKSLPLDLASSPDRLARFEREAMVLASLNHPNVAQIFDVQSASGTKYLVLEYVHGEGLNDRVALGALEIGDALRICAQIAKGVEAAHNRGIVHRDLKPENVRISSEGQVKVLDFGIAVPAGMNMGMPATADAATIIGPSAEAGLEWGKVVGTPGYMSPEQARGKPLDKRSDVFSFGCILFELLTGTMAFPGETINDRVAAAIRAEPDWSRLPKDLPENIQSLLERCLVKEVSLRLRDLGDAALELEAAVGRRVSMNTQSRSTLVVKQTGNLPGETTTFIGRVAQIDRLKTLLPTTRLVTLAGPGGCGKTRLSIRVGRDFIDTHDDGVWLIELAPVTDAPSVHGAIAAAIGIPKEGGVAPSIDVIIRKLAGMSTILLLDNCEHVLQIAARLADAILRACPNVRILATSREPLGLPGEMVFRVPSLSLPPKGEGTLADDVTDTESVRLFAERATLAKPGFLVTSQNAATIAKICWRVDGIPLAIEFAAARVKVLGVEQILDKLDSRFRLLTNNNSLVVERHQTLRATVEWSYSLLSAQEKHLLACWSVFAGGCTLEAATSLLDGEIDEFEVLDALTRLVDKSLVTTQEDGDTLVRYGMLETVKQFGFDKLSEAPQAAAQMRSRHAEIYLEIARRSAADSTPSTKKLWTARLTAERENFLSALAWLEKQGQDVMGPMLITSILREI